MIIFGSYVIHTTLGEGHFRCPQCLGTTGYRLRRGRWFLHILFIPIVPMKRAQPFVECTTCRSRFVLGVLGPSELERYRAALGDQFPGGLSGSAAGPATGPTTGPHTGSHTGSHTEPQTGSPAHPMSQPIPPPQEHLSLGATPLPPIPDPSATPAMPATPATSGAHVPPPPSTYPGVGAQPLADPYAPLGGESLALVRGIGAEVLRRAEHVTEAGAEAVRRLTRQVGVGDFTVENVRHDVDHLDTRYLAELIAGRRAANRLLEATARGLVEDAVRIACENGHGRIGDRQWDWIVTLGLDAGVGPTRSGQIRDGVLADHASLT